MKETYRILQGWTEDESGGSLVEYLHSLQRVLALGPRLVLPAHGPAIEDPETLLHGYLEHRHQRDAVARRHDGSGRPGLFDSVIQAAWRSPALSPTTPISPRIPGPACTRTA